MALRERMEVATGAPDGQSTWGDEGDSFTLQNHGTITIGTTATIFPAQTISKPNLTAPAGVLPDSLPLGAGMQSLSGVQITNGTTIVNATTLGQAITTVSLNFSIFRNIGLGVALASGVAITQISAGAPLLAPIPSGQTILLTNSAGNTQLVTTSALVSAGQTVIPINSATPGNNFATGTPGVANGTVAVLQVGNGPAFGWVSTSPVNGPAASGNTPGPQYQGGAAGSGIPILAPNASMVTPAITANTAVANGMLTVSHSDNLVVLVACSAGNATMQILNCQPLLV